MKKIYALILLISVSISLSGCHTENNLEEKQVTLVVKSIGNTTTEKFVVKQATALQLLQDKHEVKLTGSKFIRCIDDVCVNNEVQWSFYVNNDFILSSADKYNPKDKDTIEFRYGGELK